LHAEEGGIAVESQLIERASNAFGVTPSDLRILKGGTFNMVFEYTRNSRPHILRIAPQDVNTETLGEMLRYLEFLSENGLSVPCPVESRSGTYAETIREDRVYAAHSFMKVEGIPAEDLEPQKLSEQLFRDVGALVGKMHSLSKLYVPSHSAAIPQWNETGNVFSPQAKLKTTEPSIKEKYDSLLQSVLVFPKPAGSFGLIHSDTHLANIVVENEHLKVGLIDFDDLSYGWYVMDIVVTLFDALVVANRVDDVEFGETVLNSCLLGYLAHNGLDPFWIEQTPVFLKLIETSIYIKHRTDWTLGDSTSWLGKFMKNRRQRILNDVPYLALDWRRIAAEWARERPQGGLAADS